jgi:Putative transmembrane protein (PGPGW)
MSPADPNESVVDRHKRDGELRRHGRTDMDAVAADVADDPISEPRKILTVIRRSGRRVGISIAGFALVAAGVAMIVLPGPGLLVIIAGLAVLAKEFVWAERLLHKAKARAAQGTDAAKKMFRRKS